MRGDGTVYQRGPVWWIKFHRDGKPVFISCKGLTEAQARTRLKKELRKTDAEFVDPKIGRVTVGDLYNDVIADLKTRGKDHHAYETGLRWESHLKAAFEKMRAHTVGTAQLRAHRTRRSEEGASNATINRELQILRAAFRLALAHEPPKVKRVPSFTKVILREDNARQGFVTVPQIEALRDAAGEVSMAHRVLVDLGHWLGWRKGELLNLRVSNVHLFDGGPHGCIRLEATETKAKKAREVGLSPALRLYLEQLVIGKKPEDRIFPFRYLDWLTWKRIATDAGFPDLHFHDLRRSSARSKRSAGVSESVIMDIQGWATSGMFRRYAIVDGADKIDALQKQEQYERQQMIDAKVN